MFEGINKSPLDFGSGNSDNSGMEFFASKESVEFDAEATAEHEKKHDQWRDMVLKTVLYGIPAASLIGGTYMQINNISEFLNHNDPSALHYLKDFLMLQAGGMFARFGAKHVMNP